MRILFFIALIFLVGCSKYADYNYEITSVTATNADNAGPEPVAGMDTVNSASYCIQLHVVASLTAIDDKGHLDEYESSQINQDKLSSYTITCLNYFDSVIDSGDVMNDYFLFSRNNVFNSNNTIARMVSLNELGGGINVAKMYKETDNYLFLMAPPQTAGTYTFVMKAVYENGKTFNNTVTVYLQ